MVTSTEFSSIFLCTIFVFVLFCYYFTIKFVSISVVKYGILHKKNPRPVSVISKQSEVLSAPLKQEEPLQNRYIFTYGAMASSLCKCKLKIGCILARICIYYEYESEVYET